MDWKTIDSAPRDGSYILLSFPGGVHAGKFNDDRFAKKPRPYFDGDRTYLGILWYRDHQPTHWMPLPEPPK